jgi:hypothetical protein
MEVLMNKNFRKMIMLSLFLTACTTLQSNRQVIDSNSSSRPKWAEGTEVGWQEGDFTLLRSQYTVRGDQRINSCYDLARVDLKETLLTSLKDDITGELNLAGEGLSEGADPLLSKSFRSEFKGRVQGLSISEQYYERYVVGDVERIDCFVLSKIKNSDYQRLKTQLLTNLMQVSEEVAQAVRNRQKEFFAPAQDKNTVADQ